MPFATYVNLLFAVRLIAAAVFIVAGVLVFLRRVDDVFGIFVGGALVLWAIPFGLAIDLEKLAVPWFVAPMAGWLTGFIVAGTVVSFILFYFLFPDGRFVPRWMRWVALAPLAAFLALILIPQAEELVAAAWPAAPEDLIWTAFMALLLVAPLIGLLSQIQRYRLEESALRRRQTQWVIWGLAATWLIFVFTMLAMPGVENLGFLARSTAYAMQGLAMPLVMTLIPLSIVFSIFRYRLWDSGVWLSRTLVYGTLTVLIAALYAVIVGVLGLLFQGTGNTLLAVVATGIVAILFQPLRAGLQRLVNRLLYGERDDPATLLARLGRQLEETAAAEKVIPNLAATIAQALKVPFVAVIVAQAHGEADNETIAAAAGTRPQTVESFPLVYRQETIGRLEVAPRSGDDSLTPADHRLLASVAQQAGPAVHAAQLTADLRRSRQRLVTAREEERRRLRRDLHDGLGPQLAALTMKIDGARGTLTAKPEAADRLLAEAKRQAQDAVADLRGLVYELRPPALDQLGLASALRDYAAGQIQGHALQVTVLTPEPLPPLPAAVEVAAYRIALEALANVVHHAGAQSCRVTITAVNAAGNPPGTAGTAGALHLEVVDDGRGLAADCRHGVGLASMVERAVELGGSCTVEAVPAGGTRVAAVLPLGCIRDKLSETDGCQIG
jgi:signal transduction histidine kinase